MELSLPMPVQRIKAHPSVQANVGRVALQRGPLVYCLEASDTGGHIRNLVLPTSASLTVEHLPQLLGGVTVIKGQALALHQVDWPDALYLPSSAAPGRTAVDFQAIPYFANANRQPSEMMVWIAETPDKAEPLPPPTAASQPTPSASH